MTQLNRSMKDTLIDKLDPKIIKELYNTYDIIGKIAVFRIPKQYEEHSKLIAKSIMDTHREVKSVWRQSSSVSGEHRLRNLEFILGKKTVQTLYKEYGCIYKTDLKKTYFSPRLSFERCRIAKLSQKGENILNMFAGVGCFSIAIAKHSDPNKVYSIDINPFAHKYQQENIRLNRVEKKVFPMQGDAKTVIQNKLKNRADRVLMPLPEKAYEYLEYALLALKSKGGWLHYYDFEFAKKNENPVQKTEIKVLKKIRSSCKKVHVEYGRIVRPVGPRWYQIVLDINIKN
ncbi:class I SAM-dependent methyltransferase family protein [Candidatus Bathyarchaeota archaeon]|nr:class I SAM-dependent methyltransferase family protein [Candidatus Bathyarchaeota archaeon]